MKCESCGAEWEVVSSIPVKILECLDCPQRFVRFKLHLISESAGTVLVRAANKTLTLSSSDKYHDKLL